jgi:hypothetical protein
LYYCGASRPPFFCFLRNFIRRVKKSFFLFLFLCGASRPFLYYCGASVRSSFVFYGISAVVSYFFRFFTAFFRYFYRVFTRRRMSLRAALRSLADEAISNFSRHFFVVCITSLPVGVCH